jgi:hypothetical protein
MTPGIQPNNVRMMLRKKLPMRPVINTASGGKTTQKKYLSAFMWKVSSSALSCSSLVEPSTLGVGRSAFSLRLCHLACVIRSPRSRDWTTDRDKDHATVFRDRLSSLRLRFPCISRFERCEPQAFLNVAWHRERHFPEDRELPPWA